MQTLPTGMRARATADHTRSNCGFTIIELVAIIGVMGLMLLIAVPALQNFGDNTKVISAARELSGTITQMRQNSITTRRKSWMLYDLGDSSIRPATEDNQGGISWLSTLHMPEGVTITRITSAEKDGDKEITFYPTGLVESHTIELEGEGLYVELEVNALTGSISITRTDKGKAW